MIPLPMIQLQRFMMGPHGLLRASLCGACVITWGSTRLSPLDQLNARMCFEVRFFVLSPVKSSS